jgi:hypothetical protein
MQFIEESGRRFLAASYPGIDKRELEAGGQLPRSWRRLRDKDAAKASQSGFWVVILMASVGTAVVERLAASSSRAARSSEADEAWALPSPPWLTRKFHASRLRSSTALAPACSADVSTPVMRLSSR